MTRHPKQPTRSRVALLAVALFAFALTLGAASALAAGPPLVSATHASHITTTSATLEATINPSGKKTEYHFEYINDAAYQANPLAERFAGAARAPATNKSIPTGEEDVGAPVEVSGLSPATTYHFRIVALHAKEEAVLGPEQAFTTYPTPIAGLPDGRGYEQVSPVNKDGGDATGSMLTAKAAPQGGKVTFISTFGIPGGVGGQELPSYLASRGEDSWTTQGLLPPPSYGQAADIIGWTGDFSNFFEEASRFGEPQSMALLELPGDGGAIKEVVPYTPKARYFFAGASAEGKGVVFESSNKLQTTPTGLAGHFNVYVWDAASGQLSLASVLNDGSTPSKEGSFVGPYDWVKGTNPSALGQGGSARRYYTQDLHAISEDGSVYFTAAGSGQLYLRRNPTKEQSELEVGTGKCKDAAKACTIHVSATQKTNGKRPDHGDAAGTRPAAFMAATQDGSKVFFTSSEKLTNDANTGPEPDAPAIGRANVADGLGKVAEFLPRAAAGMTVFGEHIYWANPSAGTIGRAKLNGASPPSAIEEPFITPGAIKVEEGGETTEVPSTPQYVAVDAGHVYWTDAADRKDKHGTVGRAKLGFGEAVEDIKAEFIKGASNPQGIAVNASTIYWADAGREGSTRGIGCAEIGGGNPNQECIDFGNNNDIPEGLALDGAHLYWTLSSEYAPERNIFLDYIKRADLDGGNQVERLLGENFDSFDVRGVAVDGGHVYWVEQRKGAIGRADLDLTPGSVETEFMTAAGSLKGVAVDSEHIYFSANGEAPVNPGNDLYRYEPGTEALSDLTVDPTLTDANGAEVKGVLGTSKDGSDVYFAANGVLGTGADPGNCIGALGLTGECNLYRWHDDGTPQGAVTFIARLEGGGEGSQTDASNWLGTPNGIFLGDRNFRKTAWVSNDGQTLLFSSQQQLGSYDNEGVAELYRYEVGKGISCVSCNPSGAAPSGPPSLGTVNPSALLPTSPASVSSLNFAAEGKRIFFESTDALVPADTNGEEGCPSVGSGSQAFPRCLDVYEWEAPEMGSCQAGGPAFSPQDGGCLYLLSSGKSSWPSFFMDASASGEDAFLFTREGLVGQDKDELLDLYDARVGGGIASQNLPLPNPCESAEACHGPASTPPPGESAGSASFSGPGDAKPKQQRKHAKHHKKQKQGKKKHHRAKAKGRASR